MIDYCTCLKGKTDGYKNLNGLWVHSKCEKPAKVYWMMHVVIPNFIEELDTIMERFLSRQEAEDGLDKGRLEIACYFIAVLQNPTQPDIIKVRDEAVQRYREKQREAENGL